MDPLNGLCQRDGQFNSVFQRYATVVFLAEGQSPLKPFFGRLNITPCETCHAVTCIERPNASLFAVL